MTAPKVTFDNAGEPPTLRLQGALTMPELSAVEGQFLAVPESTAKLQIDMSLLTRLDTGGAWLVAQLQERLEAAGNQSELVGVSDEYRALVEAVRSALPDKTATDTQPATLLYKIERFGAAIVSACHTALSLVNFVGLVLHRVMRTILQPGRLRLTALVSQAQDVGLSAVPIIALMGFLIGVVLAFQGAVQLRQFGAEVFVVDLIAVSVLRELGILLTAIIVAGRSGSAFTASIGSMKVREEIDAMYTLGLDPMEVLVLPRILALVFMLPILGVIANVCALLGGALMSWLELGISPGMFMTRFGETTNVWHLAIGMIKAPFFAFIIGIISCWQAFRVAGSSDSVGRCTTASVVQSIFLVIVADAIFSIIFQELGV